MPRNYTLAREWFEKGADVGDADCTFNLGTLYQGGHGVPRNQSKAVELFEKARAKGSWRACYQLMMLYEGGWAGGAASLSKAVTAFRCAGSAALAQWLGQLS